VKGVPGVKPSTLRTLTTLKPPTEERAQKGSVPSMADGSVNGTPRGATCQCKRTSLVPIGMYKVKQSPTSVNESDRPSGAMTLSSGQSVSLCRGRRAQPSVPLPW
jgi:hypothetical protein